MIEPVLYDQARERIESDGFTPDVQTKIALLLSATKTGNAAYHSWVQWMARLDVMQQYAFTQYSRELEAVSVLLRTARWSTNPALLIRANQIIAPLATARMPSIAAWPWVMRNSPVSVSRRSFPTRPIRSIRSSSPCAASSRRTLECCNCRSAY